MSDESFSISTSVGWGDGAVGCCDAEALRLMVDLPMPGVRVVRVAGELDLLTAPQLDGLLLSQIEDGGGQVVVDLGEVSFFGAAGLGSLVRAREVAHCRGVELYLTGVGNPAVATPVTVAKLHTTFAVHPSTHAVLAAVAGDGELSGPGCVHDT